MQVVEQSFLDTALFRSTESNLGQNLDIVDIHFIESVMAGLAAPPPPVAHPRPCRVAKPVTRDWVARRYHNFPPVVIVEDAAAMTGHKPATIRRWIRSEYYLPARRSPLSIGRTRGRVQVDRDEFVRLWLNRA